MFGFLTILMLLNVLFGCGFSYDNCLVVVLKYLWNTLNVMQYVRYEKIENFQKAENILIFQAKIISERCKAK